MSDKFFITRTEPEAAIVLWRFRDFPATRLIEDDPRYVCDQCNRSLDWEPFPVVVLPTREELRDPSYDPIGGNAFCRACARKFYHLTKKDVYRTRWIWYGYGWIRQENG